MITLYHCILLISLDIFMECSRVELIERYDSYKNQLRLTSIQDGDFVIQSLNTLTNGSQSCEVVSRDGVIRSFAMKYAVDKANNNTNLTQWAIIGLRLDDVCNKLSTTMARGIEAVSLLRPNSVCRENFLHCSKELNASLIKPATAIIGTSMSYTSVPLASLMTLYGVPMISYWATTRILNKKKLYSTFFRTIPSDVDQVSAMLSVMESFHWDTVFAVGSDDDYGRSGLDELENKASARNICISDVVLIPTKNLTDSLIKNVVKKINDSDAVVVVLFCYVEDVGRLIIKEADSVAARKIWLTSEAWNPSAVVEFSKNVVQAHGILTVSLKTYPLPNLRRFIKEEIENNLSNHMWLKNYVKHAFKCQPNSVCSDKKSLQGQNCTVSIETILKDLYSIVDFAGDTINSVSAVVKAIELIMQKHRNSSVQVVRRELVDTLKNVSFVDEQGKEISFNSNHNLGSVYYSIENLQAVENGSLAYKTVGNYSSNKDESQFALEKDKVVWPHWFQKSHSQRYPRSQCTSECIEGQFVSGRIGCCWSCENCLYNTFSDIKMSPICYRCETGYHTKDNINCLPTPTNWIQMLNYEGLAVMIVCSIGVACTLFSLAFLYKYRHILQIDSHTEYNLNILSCVIVTFTFAFGFLVVIKPTKTICSIRKAAFYFFVMFYSAYFLIKTASCNAYLNSKADQYLGQKRFVTRLLFIMVFVLLELICALGFIVDNDTSIGHVVYVFDEVAYENDMMCYAEFNTYRWICTFLPYILLFIATFLAFRERLDSAPIFHEPILLLSGSISLCIINVVFLPTFLIVKDKYKSIVEIFTLSAAAYTVLICFIVPKVYIAYMRVRWRVMFPNRRLMLFKHSSGTIQFNDGRKDNIIAMKARSPTISSGISISQSLGHTNEGVESDVNT